jgi:hypothetical protein
MKQANAATTINQICKAIVAGAIDHDYLLECETKGHDLGSRLHSIYWAEYGSFNSTSPKACRDYLQGLPSVCAVPFWNDEILELLAKAGITRKSEAAKEKLINDYWLACGNAFYNMVK